MLSKRPRSASRLSSDKSGSCMLAGALPNAEHHRRRPPRCGSFPATHHHPITRTEIDVTAHPNASARDYPQADSQYPDPNKAPPLQPDEIYNLAAQSHLAVVCSAAFLMRLSASSSAHRHCEEAQPTRQSRGLAFRVVKRPMQREIVRGWNGIATSAAPLRNGMRTGVAPNSPFPTSRFSPTGFQRAVS